MSADDGRSEEIPAPRRRSLARESGFWHRVTDRKGMGKSDVFRLREDLKRMEDLIERVAESGGCCGSVMDEIHQVRETLSTDFGTQALVLQTLIEVLVDKGVMTEDEFADKLDEIDARDGRMDGMIHPGGGPDENPNEESQS